MAFLYKRPDSPYFWISHSDAAGRRRAFSTGFRHAAKYPVEIRKALALEAKFSAEEIGRLNHKSHVGWSWVDPWLAMRYGHSIGTLTRYTAAWKILTLFLAAQKIANPDRFLRSHCFDYMDWRTKEHPDLALRKACHNVALNEVHIFGIILNEALNRSLINANPCVRLGIRKHESKRKPELTELDIELIRQEIPKVKSAILRDMLNASFEIARHQGCRIAETRIHLRDDVDFSRNLITFRTKTRKAHTTALHPATADLVKSLIADGKEYSWVAPEGYHPGRWAAQRWSLFMAKIGLRQLGRSFHCCRVTVVTELARSGVTRTQAMAFVGHSESMTHSVYSRLQPEDLSQCVQAIGRPKSPGTPRLPEKAGEPLSASDDAGRKDEQSSEPRRR